MTWTDQDQRAFEDWAGRTRLGWAWSRMLLDAAKWATDRRRPMA